MRNAGEFSVPSPGGDGCAAHPRFWEQHTVIDNQLLSSEWTPVGRDEHTQSQSRTWRGPWCVWALAPAQLGDSGWLQQTLEQKMRAATAVWDGSRHSLFPSSLTMHVLMRHDRCNLLQKPKIRFQKILCILAATYSLQTWFSTQVIMPS